MEQQPEDLGSCTASHCKKRRNGILVGTSDITGRLNSGDWQLRLSLNWSWALKELDFLPPDSSGRSFRSVESPQILTCESSILDQCQLRTKSARRNVKSSVYARPERPARRPGRSDTSDTSDTSPLGAACSQVEQLVKMQRSQQRPQQLPLGRPAKAPKTAKKAKDQCPTVKRAKRATTSCRFHSDTSGLIALITKGNGHGTLASGHLQCGTSVTGHSKRYFCAPQ